MAIVPNSLLASHFYPATALPDFMPHGYCYLWDPTILWVNVIADSLITLSYYCIPLVLVYFIRRNRNLPINRMFWMFGTFIVACGTTHLMEVWNVWHNNYVLAGVLKVFTAGISLATAFMLTSWIPKVISLPERMYLQGLNRNLQHDPEPGEHSDPPGDLQQRRRVAAGSSSPLY